MNIELHYQVEQFLYRHAERCDSQDWDAYLADYAPDCEYHVPQWDSEPVYTTDPKREMSLIYYASRAGLEDRVFRIRTGKSAACNPMPRTLHQLTNIRVERGADGLVEARVNWATFYTRFGETGYFYGRAAYTLERHGDGWRIRRQHVLLLNDTVNAVLDFYHL